ncbi:hypothetical protein A3I34_01785 [Candidatus Jorgensenbacteria bacterium RIFCSPLOWO2_02_FULL_45_12]|uniref:Phage holin family protein n=1 Tax=Candidatus Jorgensenbacteria bacterium RIFCSPHIGHO2_02_FULL_45_20 TaxID=1798470 RepID=A0A1F6BNM6_9BACT|nr:MAG: hypothetical protein A3D55_02190 [Candidatus Jorgensenbacteria bacterium RIFCSPHIGHO2_02_FULL_45_20]OGG42330.1 MAG: hypothetical protein A3I34_01785 [Candidatus Jorgensenbacteria bacterium RIFCSPLOWO2_02_FULL_45_12]
MGKLIMAVVSNSIAIYAAARFIDGVSFTGGFVDLGIAAAILTLINMFIRPVLKLIFGPVILLTLGLFLLAINALTVYLLDFWSAPINIEGYVPLFLASLLISAVNFLVTSGGKAAFKE